MKNKYQDFDREKKIHRVVKGTNKAGKHRKNIYNMLSEYDDEEDSDSEYSVVMYSDKQEYTKQR